MAHLPAHVFFAAESKQNGYQGDARTPSPRVLPSHIGYVYPSDHDSKEKSPERCHSSSACARCSCWLIGTRAPVPCLCLREKAWPVRKHWSSETGGSDIAARHPALRSQAPGVHLLNRE